MVNQKAKTIELKADSDREFFLIHGYTGSPRDFENLPELLNKKFNASVKVIRLKGHGTKVEDLLNYKYSDYKEQLETELKKEIKKGKKITVGGFSFGGVLALYLASKFKVEGVFTICPPIKLRFPLNLKLLSYIRFLKPIWDKNLSNKEKKEIDFTFYYDEMPSLGLKICQEASKEALEGLDKINCPILSIFSGKDDITSSSASKKIERKIIPLNLKNILFKDANHRPSSKKFLRAIKKEIIFFIEKNYFNTKSEDSKNKVVAIIPSYNEAKRIGNVLTVLNNTKIIDEIIVVDDGSTDDTKKIVKKFKRVKYFRNKKNIGKAGSMERGVKSTDADIIFFCDADLIGLKPEIVKGIIEPVKKGDFNMFIGLRGNFMQKTVHLFALNSGERALKRVVWERLPRYFKYKYRVEAGLNYCVKRYFGGFGYKTFNYSNPIQEEKHGFLRGTIFRWRMNIDVLSAYIREIFGRV